MAKEWLKNETIVYGSKKFKSYFRKNNIKNCITTIFNGRWCPIRNNGRDLDILFARTALAGWYICVDIPVLR